MIIKPKNPIKGFHFDVTDSLWVIKGGCVFQWIAATVDNQQSHSCWVHWTLIAAIHIRSISFETIFTGNIRYVHAALGTWSLV